MPDVALVYDPENMRADAQISGADLLTEPGLTTALIASLLSDARAEPDTELPDDGDDRRGYWGDAFAEVEGDRFGSLLWTLEREKKTDKTRKRAEEYARAALVWLIEDLIARAVEVTGELYGLDQLRVRIIVEKPDGTQYRFEFAWEGL